MCVYFHYYSTLDVSSCRCLQSFFTSLHLHFFHLYFYFNFSSSQVTPFPTIQSRRHCTPFTDILFLFLTVPLHHSTYSLDAIYPVFIRGI